jgi:uncharacterized protein YcfJ
MKSVARSIAQHPLRTATLALPLLAGVTVPAFAQENARVISSTPVIQQVAVPQQYCTQQPVVTSAPKSGAGAVMGAIAGGAAGNAIGNGSGRAAATAIGLIGGALLGDRIEGSPQQVQNVQHCSTQTTYESRTVGYNVVYEYAGRQYTTQTAQDPGQYIAVQVSPVGAQGGSMAVPPVTSQPPVMSPPVTYVQPQPGVVVSTVPVAPVIYSPPVVYPSPYYARPYYPPVGISLNFGYSNWRGHHGPRWR